MRLLFSSPHCYLDTSSGAALATRGLLSLLTSHASPCAVFCGDRLDFERPPPLADLLQLQGLSGSSQRAFADGVPFSLTDVVANGVPVSIFSLPEQPAGAAMPPAAGAAFLRLLDGILDRFRPDIVLTYGGDELTHGLITRVRQRGLPVVFALHNFAYKFRSFFDPVSAILVPSAFAAEHYGRQLGLTCRVLPLVWDWRRIQCERVEGRFVTFVNPQPHKGVFWFVRLALELGQRRPDIPLLVVEGRAGVEVLARTGVDLSGLRNLHRMANTPDPRDFYRVSRAVLMPSLWQESLPRVPIEAHLNGIPVLASNRGGLPESLGDAGFLFNIPAHYQPETRQLPTAAEVAPWLAVLERLWDDPDWYAVQRQRCLAAAERYRPERVLPEYERFFREVAGQIAR
jgi:glycosyltransferase involved in cell wall biosynthesis